MGAICAERNLGEKGQRPEEEGKILKTDAFDFASYVQLVILA